mmetsp:Transcript_3255/g.5455  ORF Transcript_3255/g.5455 Transcript_3255/m.5455 type:complete len:157 (-) Transcript_3255:474-944(-)
MTKILEESPSSSIDKQQTDNDGDGQHPTETAAATPPTTTIKPPSSTTQNKIKVHLVAVGSAPILKKNKFLMNRTDNFGVAISFLRKRLKLPDGSSTAAAAGTSSSTTPPSSSSSSLFLYINSAFVPCPTEQIGDLYDCFGMREELVIHYSLQEAWG